MSRRAKRMGIWASAAVCVTLAGALVWGVVRPASVGSGGVVVATAAGKIEVAWADCPLRRQGIAYNLNYPQGNGSILVAAESGWRPSIARAAIGVSPSVLYRLRVLYVPLWPWTLVTAGVAVGMWKWAGKVVLPGHCAACGYDLSGLSQPKCPECGAAAKLIRWLLARIRCGAVGLASRG